ERLLPKLPFTGAAGNKPQPLAIGREGRVNGSHPGRGYGPPLSLDPARGSVEWDRPQSGLLGARGEGQFPAVRRDRYIPIQTRAGGQAFRACDQAEALRLDFHLPQTFHGLGGPLKIERPAERRPNKTGETYRRFFDPLLHLRIYFRFDWRAAIQRNSPEAPVLLAMPSPQREMFTVGAPGNAQVFKLGEKIRHHLARRLAVESNHIDLGNLYSIVPERRAVEENLPAVRRPARI